MSPAIPPHVGDTSKQSQAYPPAKDAVAELADNGRAVVLSLETTSWQELKGRVSTSGHELDHFVLSIPQAARLSKQLQEAVEEYLYHHGEAPKAG